MGGRALRYLEAGAGWPVVLLHAFPLSSDMWRPQLDQPPAGCRLLAPDLRGFGPGAGPAASSLEEMAADVLAWLDALALDRVTVGGLSMGGYVIFRLFRQAPERFTGVILANTKAVADTPEARADRDKMSELVRAEGPSAIADQMVPKLLGKTSIESRPEARAAVRRIIEGNTTEGIDGAIRAIRDRPDSTDLLAGIGCPALVIAGAEDVLIPVADVEAMQRGLPRSHFVVLARSGHLSNLETPADFSTALADFLRAHL